MTSEGEYHVIIECCAFKLKRALELLIYGQRNLSTKTMPQESYQCIMWMLNALYNRA